MHLGNRPHFACSAGEYNRVLPTGGKVEPVGQSTRNHDQGGSCVNQKIDVLTAAGGADQTPGNTK